MTRRILLAAMALIALGFTASATTYNGNGDTSFGGPVGLGSLTLTDNGTTVTGTINNGNTGSGFNDALVLYIQVGSGGTFTDTSSFGDNGDGLREAISGYNGNNRSLLTFASGFMPNYAIALGPKDDSFGGLWGLASGGANSLNYITSVNLSPLGTGSSSTYTFSFDLSSIGLTGGQSFEFFGTYISDTGYRSSEAVAGNDSGTPGWNPYTQSSFATYATEPVPEPSAAAFGSLAGLVALLVFKRRK